MTRASVMRKNQKFYFFIKKFLCPIDHTSYDDKSSENFIQKKSYDQSISDEKKNQKK